MDLISWSPSFVVENENECKEYLNNEDVWDKIPLLNCNDLHDFKDNSLIRFRGMVQDMHNPEFYLEKYEVQTTNGEKLMKNGKYRDTADISENESILFEGPNNVTSGRQTYVLISLPGVNSWVHQIEKEKHVLPEKSKNITTNASSNSTTKRSLEDEEEMETEPCPTENSSETNEKTESNKKHCTNPSTSSTSQPSVVSKEHILNFPIAEQNGKCCHVKMYNDNESLKLNEMIDVIGFLSVDPSLTDLSYHNNEEDSEMEIQTHHPPPSLVPRIHCIAFRKLNDCNPLTKIIPITQEQLPNLRKELSIVLTQLLMGDELSADYLICHLVSSIYLRKELLTLGKFSLNISNVPAVKYPNYGEELYEILEMLLPKSHYLPMTLDNMNSLSFIPKKDYDCNRLTSGILQLSNNTHLILDETRMQPGKLNESGCRGIAALSSTIKNQKVNYDFNYYQMEFECDIPFLVLSEGKSLLPSDFHIPMVPDDHHLNTFPEIKEAAKHFLKPELLNNIRSYISKVRFAEYELPESTMELVQNEFVKMRQNEKITGEDLHQLLVLARLVCLSLGKSSLDQECWYKACEMENKRKERLSVKKNTPEP